MAQRVAAAFQLGPSTPPCTQRAVSGVRPCMHSRKRRTYGPVRATASSFDELRSAATNTVAAAQSKLGLLEQAKNTAERAREPAAEAERVWQDAHARLTKLQQEATTSMETLREGVVSSAGGESPATHALLKRLLSERLEHFRMNTLAAATDYRVYAPRDLPLHCIPGGRAVYQLAVAEQEGAKFAVVALGLANPFLFDNMRSLLLHWGCAEGANAGWAQPPKGWHTSPGVSTPAGSLAWDTALGAYAPLVQGEPVIDAAAYAVLLQIPLEGFLELRGGIKCVLKRTDGGQPEWIKAGHHNNSDFFLDFTPVINHFERKRREAQAAALAQARAAALASGQMLDDDEDEEAEVATKSTSSSSSLDVEDAPKDKVKAGKVTRTRRKKKAEELPPLPEEEAPYAAKLPEWVARLDQFVQLSDMPLERGLEQHLKCLTRLATAVAEAGGPGEMEARALLQRCRDTESLLHQLDLAELAARVAQQEKEQLQAIYKSASDESSHLMTELTAAAESARRTAVKLRGRETEVTQRDLEAVAQQSSEELLKRNNKGVWPFKEERQLVFVQQKVMQVDGRDARVVVQVYVEGTKAAVHAATTPKTGAANGATNGAASSSEKGAEVDAAMVASQLAPMGQDNTAPPTVLAAAAEALAVVGKKAAEKEKQKKEKEKERATFDHVVVSISLAEDFPDGGLKTPVIMHCGLVAHQHAQWQPPPGKWQALPEHVSLSKSGSAAQIPFQRFTMSSEEGTPVFVDPTLFALAMRLPLKECLDRGVRGVEFVLKTADGQWLSWQQGHGQSCNFYAELPLPLP